MSSLHKIYENQILNQNEEFLLGLNETLTEFGVAFTSQFNSRYVRKLIFESL